jgi:hypothetical protein
MEKDINATDEAIRVIGHGKTPAPVNRNVLTKCASARGQEVLKLAATAVHRRAQRTTPDISDDELLLRVLPEEHVDATCLG